MESDIYKLVPEKMNTESCVNYCRRIRTAWGLVSGKISLEQYLNLVLLKSGSYADELEEFLAKKPVSLDSVIKHILKLYDQSTTEYFHDYKNAQPYGNENLVQYAQRLKSLYKRSRNDDSPITAAEERLLVEKFLDSLPLNDARLLRICSTPEEMTTLDLLATRAARSIKSPNRVTSVTSEENYDENTDDLQSDILELILDD